MPSDVGDEALMMEDDLVVRLGWEEDDKMEGASVCGICLSRHV